MKFLIFSILISSSVFASEKEGLNACDSYRQRADKIQREMNKVSLELSESHRGPEETYTSPEPHAGNCEEDHGSNHSALISRRDKLEKELADVRREIKSACPRVYPE